jgi:hypothetical protein
MPTQFGIPKERADAPTLQQYDSFVGLEGSVWMWMLAKFGRWSMTMMRRIIKLSYYTCSGYFVLYAKSSNEYSICNGRWPTFGSQKLIGIQHLFSINRSPFSSLKGVFQTNEQDFQSRPLRPPRQEYLLVLATKMYASHQGFR